MRVAFCISGQPRTWQANVQSWRAIVPDGAEVDIFAHIWDFQTTKGSDRQTVSPTEIDALRATIQPRRYLVESERSYHHTEPPNTPPENWPAVGWAASQYYGIMRCAELKRQYEVEHNFDYDLCVRLRFDMVIECGSPLTLVDYGTVHAVHISFEERYHQQRIGDISFFARSMTYDRLTSYYRYMPMILNCWFQRPQGDDICPEFALYYFMKMQGLSSHYWPLVTKLRRTPEYASTWGLMDYETV